MLNLTELKNSEINTKPYNYIVLKNFINDQSLDNARRDYPVVPGPGSHPGRACPRCTATPGRGSSPEWSSQP